MEPSINTLVNVLQQGAARVFPSHKTNWICHKVGSSNAKFINFPWKVIPSCRNHPLSKNIKTSATWYPKQCAHVSAPKAWGKRTYLPWSQSNSRPEERGREAKTALCTGTTTRWMARPQLHVQVCPLPSTPKPGCTDPVLMPWTVQVKENSHLDIEGRSSVGAFWGLAGHSDF